MFPGSIRCMDLCDSGLIISIDQKTGYADYGQESVTHSGFCIDGSENTKVMRTHTEISNPFAYSKKGTVMNNISIESRAVHLQQKSISQEFPNFVHSKKMDVNCRLKMVHTMLHSQDGRLQPLRVPEESSSLSL
jgi:hypothetical protein